MYETIIIGAGIAGCTAAIYASRKRMNYLFISEEFGGQFYESAEVLNYPGIVQTSGVDFAGTMQKQLDFNNVKMKKEQVVKITKKGKTYKVKTNKKEYETQTVILCTGARPRQLGVPGESEFKNKGVTYCAICDGPIFQGMDIAIVGGGNSACEAVDFMKNIAKKIHLINITDSLIAHEYLQEKIKKNKKVTIHHNTKTVEVLGDKMVNAIRVEENGKQKDIKVQGIIVEIGRLPNTEFLKGFVDLDEHKHIEVDGWCYTSKEGVFAAGDCCSIHEYQYTIAAGQGCIALLKAARYLASSKERK